MFISVYVCMDMKVLLAMTGASGVIYGVRLLKELSEREDITVDLVISDSGKELLKGELDIEPSVLDSYARKTYESRDLGAPPSSGSSLYEFMLIVPCSMSTLSQVAAGTADNLITRAAGVMLKERRGLLMVPRETPLSTIHLENMARLSRDGCLIVPASPAFYGKPETVEQLVDFIVGKTLDLMGIENDSYTRWEGTF